MNYIKYIILGTLLVIFSACTNANKKVEVNQLPPKKTFVKEEKNTSPSNRNAYYPPMNSVGYGYQQPMMPYPQNNTHPYNNRGGVAYGGYYQEPLGNGPLTHQNSAEDIENQRRGRD